ncbi:MAG: hypothetical protein Q7J54_01450 [Candidatus Woesearchaeota archaeon]|nr:hypothetical protein [Candidatus Woesearchaeota archaeon]
MKFKKLNKKGYAGALVDFFAWIAYFIILMIFVALFYFAVKVDKERVLTGINVISESSLLYSYFRTPVSSVIGKQKIPNMAPEATMSELIIRYYLDDNLKQLRPIFKDFFDPIFFIDGSNDWRGWKIKIYLEPEDKLLFDEDGSMGANLGGLNYILSSTADLSIPSDDNYLKIELWKKGRGAVLDDPLYKK